MIHKLYNEERIQTTGCLLISIKTGGGKGTKSEEKSQSVYTGNSITLYLYSCLEFTQFVVLKHFQILTKNNYITNLQVTKIIF